MARGVPAELKEIRARERDSEAAELDKVTGWRLETLTEAGYPLQFAQALAERHDVDLHEAVELVKACPPETAVSILL